LSDHKILSSDDIKKKKVTNLFWTENCFFKRTSTNA